MELGTDSVEVLVVLVDPGKETVHVGLLAGPDREEIHIGCLADPGREEIHTAPLADIGAWEGLARFVAYLSCRLEKG